MKFISINCSSYTDLTLILPVYHKQKLIITVIILGCRIFLLKTSISTNLSVLVLVADKDANIGRGDLMRSVAFSYTKKGMKINISQ